MHSEGEYQIANLLFQVPNPKARGNSTDVLLSYVVKGRILDLDFSKIILSEYQHRLTIIENLYLGLSMKQYLEPEQTVKRQEIFTLTTELFNDIPHILVKKILEAVQV